MNARADAVCHIVAAAPGGHAAFVPAPGDFVIAADGGWRTCTSFGVEPDLFVGDYDSLDASELDGAGVRKLELPREKDDTDTLAAVRSGLQLGYRSFHLHAALGGDVGHTLANLQTLLFIREHGSDGLASGGGQTAYAVVPGDGLRPISACPGCRVSVFAAGSAASGVREQGMQWELDGAVLAPSYPLGVSNKALGATVHIGVGEGALLVIVG